MANIGNEFVALVEMRAAVASQPAHHTIVVGQAELRGEGLLTSHCLSKDGRQGLAILRLKRLLEPSSQQLFLGSSGKGLPHVVHVRETPLGRRRPDQHVASVRQGSEVRLAVPELLASLKNALSHDVETARQHDDLMHTRLWQGLKLVVAVHESKVGRLQSGQGTCDVTTQCPPQQCRQQQTHGKQWSEPAHSQRLCLRILPRQVVFQKHHAAAQAAQLTIVRRHCVRCHHRDASAIFRNKQLRNAARGHLGKPLHGETWHHVLNQAPLPAQTVRHFNHAFRVDEQQAPGSQISGANAQVGRDDGSPLSKVTLCNARHFLGVRQSIPGRAVQGLLAAVGYRVVKGQRHAAQKQRQHRQRQRVSEG